MNIYSSNKVVIADLNIDPPESDAEDCLVISPHSPLGSARFSFYPSYPKLGFSNEFFVFRVLIFVVMVLIFSVLHKKREEAHM